MNQFKHFASVSCVIYNNKNEILLVSADRKKWETIGGWLEDETVTDCIHRELKEELGNFNYRISDIIDAHTFKYNSSINLISIWSMVEYISGSIKPDDDIKGHFYQWFQKDELTSLNIKIPQQKEIIQKASFYIDLYNKNESLPFLKYLWEDK